MTDDEQPDADATAIFRARYPTNHRRRPRQEPHGRHDHWTTHGGSMSTETILETARRDWANLTGTIAPHGIPEIHLTYQADRTIAMSPNDARELARWLTDAARQIEVNA